MSASNRAVSQILRLQLDWCARCHCLTLACLSAGGGDLILPEVFTRVCMAKQLIPGQGPQYVRKVSTDTTCSEWWRGRCMGVFLVVGL